MTSAPIGPSVWPMAAASSRRVHSTRDSDDLRAIVVDLAQRHFVLVLQPKFAEYTPVAARPTHELDAIATAQAADRAADSVTEHDAQKYFPGGHAAGLQGNTSRSEPAGLGTAPRRAQRLCLEPARLTLEIAAGHRAAGADHHDGARACTLHGISRAWCRTTPGRWRSPRCWSRCCCWIRWRRSAMCRCTCLASRRRFWWR